MMRRIGWLGMLAGIVLLVVGCGGEAGERYGWQLREPDAGAGPVLVDGGGGPDGRVEPDGGEEPDGGVEPDGGGDPDGGATCEGQPPNCVTTCSSDALTRGECEGGRWVCPDGMQPVSECPDDVCMGPAPPDCVTRCRGGEERSPICADGLPMCPDGSFSEGQYCEDSHCQQVTQQIEMPGVSMQFDGPCRFPIEEVREQGIEIPYRVIIEEPVEGVVPDSVRSRCNRPGESGLILFEAIRGDDQEYCRCNRGLCQNPDFEPRTLQPGSYQGSIEWQGRNWQGPSDTGRPKGEPFPPGTYTVSVRAEGEIVGEGSQSTPFVLEQRMEIQLIE